MIYKLYKIATSNLMNNGGEYDTAMRAMRLLATKLADKDSDVLWAIDGDGDLALEDLLAGTLRFTADYYSDDRPQECEVMDRLSAVYACPLNDTPAPEEQAVYTAWINLYQFQLFLDSV